MSDPAATLARFSRYESVIQSLVAVPEGFEPAVEGAASVQVERGEMLALALDSERVDRDALSARAERLIELARYPERLGTIAVVDRQDHHRPVYRPILVYSFLQSFRLLYERLPQSEFGRWEEGSRLWADLLEAELTTGKIETSDFVASRGGAAAEMTWTALALHVAGRVFVRDAFTDLASHFFGKLTRAQQENGAFLAATASDNPETMWYHELAVLHAAASYAVQAEDRAVAKAVQRSTRYHHAETQADHASTQPFGVFAFVWNPETEAFADQLLHATQTQNPGGVSGLGAVLLADAVQCLGLFGRG